MNRASLPLAASICFAGSLSLRGRWASRFLLCAAVLLPVTISAWTTTPALASERIKLDRLSLAEGLSQVSAQTSLQDHRGFIWVGTQDGLNRFDGHEVVVFKHDPSDPHSLVDNFVRTLFEDRDGKLWVLTQQPGGIHRYDPLTERFQRFVQDPENPEAFGSGLPLPGVVFQDRQGLIWFSTNLGVERVDPSSGKVRRFGVEPGNPEALGSVVSTFYEDRSGTLWLGTFGSGLHRWIPPSSGEPGKFERFQASGAARSGTDEAPGPLSHNTVSAILEDSQGNLWVGTQGGGVNRMVDPSGLFEVWDSKTPEQALVSDVVPLFLPGAVLPVSHAIYEDASGELWVVTAGGLNRRRGNRVTQYTGTDEQPGFFTANPIVAVEEDRWGDLWIGTTSAGVVRFERSTERFTHLRHDPADPQSLSSDLVLQIWQDRAGVIWMGTNNGGISRYSRYRHKFKHYSRPMGGPPQLANNMVFSIEQDRRGDLWLGTVLGLYRLDSYRRDVVEHYFADPAGGPRNLGAPLVRAILEDSQGRLWVGTLGGGLAQIDPERGEVVKRYIANPGAVGGISNNQVFGIQEDRSEPGILWVSTAFGWNRFDPEREIFRSYFNDPTDPTSLAANFSRCTYEDGGGVLWVCTGGGVSRFDRESETFAQFMRDPSDPESLASNNIMDLWNDGKGTLWIATYGGGLDRLDLATSKVRHLTHKDGLPSDSLYSLLPDETGRLWISSNQGLTRLDPNTLSMENFDLGDGLQSTEFNGRSFLRTEEGEMLFGGVNGINAFFVDQVEHNPHAPEVVLTTFKVFDQPRESDLALEYRDHLELSYKDRFFAFEFAALDFSDPASNRFAYKLAGFDDGWVDAGSRRFAGYTNLDGGEYVFKVRAANGDGVWNELGTSLRVVIVPPWWKTWWAYALYFFSAVGCFYFYVRQKTLRHEEELELHRQESDRQRMVAERLQQIDRMKDEFLANTSHELRTPLNGIIGLAESLLDGVTGALPEPTRRNLSMIAGSGRRLAHLVDDILDFSKLKNHQIELNIQAVSLREVADIVLTLMAPLVKGKEVELINRIPDTLPEVAGDENRLQQVLHNLVGNAVKFTDHGSVTVSASRDGEQVELRVTDTGIGIPADQLEKVFEGFEQADASSARQYGGTGLGLTITRQLVELHGGEVHLRPAETEQGGTEAVLRLPRWRGEKPEPALGSGVRQLIAVRDAEGRDDLSALSSVEPVVGQPGAFEAASEPEQAPTMGRVLVVDDEPINRQVLRNFLTLARFEVIEAVDGIQALEIIEGGDVPDLLLLDVMMPRMTGFEVTRRLRARLSGNELPILLVTAKNQVSDLMEGLASGANDYLSKPISKNELLARIETHLSLSRAHSVEAENRRKTEEFERARSIQLSMLPDAPPALDGYEIAVYLETASEVGGDYYDFFPQDQDSFYVVTGDATGHGISAGMMVSMTKSALKALDVQSPHVLLRQLNQVFRAVRVEHMKMALNVLHLREGEVAVSSAAMPPVFVYRAASGEVEEILKSSLPLGSLEDLEYPIEVFPLGPGDTLMLLSDGLPETMDEDGEQLGYGAVEHALGRHGNRPSGEILQELVELGNHWRGDRPLDDDVTLVVIKRRS